MKPTPPSPSPRAAFGVEPSVLLHCSSPEPPRRPMSMSYAAAATTPPPRSSDDSCVINDVDAFARTVAAIRSKPPPPASESDNHSSLASVLSHYAARWLPDATSSPSSGRFFTTPPPPPPGTGSPTATWLKTRLLLESLVAALPPDDASASAPASDGITCDFLLRLLRAGRAAGADAALLGDLEARAARRLDEASLAAVMVPTCGFGGASATATLLDVPLMLRLVRGFLREGGGCGAAAATAKVARLVDAYMAEAALEAALRPAGFEELARAVPAHARADDDGLYRAVDTYLKAHPRASKEERRSLCRLIDARKLSAEAAGHAAQNDRLPVRCVLQVLFLSVSEHHHGGSGCQELGGHHHRRLLADRSGGGSFRDLLLQTSSSRSPPAAAVSHDARCPSKREAVLAQAQHHELRRLREDVARLQMQCHALQAQVDRLLGSESRQRRGLFRWGAAFLFGGTAAAARIDDSDSGAERTPLSSARKHHAPTTATGTPVVARWRRSHS